MRVFGDFIDHKQPIPANRKVILVTEKVISASDKVITTSDIS